MNGTPWRGFGAPRAGHRYRDRPCSYALLLRRGRVLVVEVPELQLAMLPGGGAERGESPAETARREVREEVGLDVRLECEVARATSWGRFPSGAWVRKIERFYLASPATPRAEPGAGEHRWRWLDPVTARQRLSPPSHRWALERALARAGPNGISRPGGG